MHILSCEQLDLAFIESEQKVSKGLLAKRNLIENAYYGKIKDDGSFPLGSGTRIKQNRLGRVTLPPVGGWRSIEDSACATNACDYDPDVISHGNSSFYYSLVQRDLRSDWLCLDSLALREEAMAEVQHFEDGLGSASRFVHEEFRRSRFILFSGNKLLAKVEAVGGVGDNATDPVADFESCDDVLNQAFVFETGADGEIDEMHIRVCCNPDEINLISELTLDMLEYATPRLMYENPMAKEVGGVLFDVLMADQRMKSKMALQENALLSGSASYGGYNMFDLSQQWGTEGVLRNFSLRSDYHAMRFYEDATYNTANSITSGDFDENDPNTWPRFVRALPFKNVRSKGLGVESQLNNAYQRAPFGISVLRTNRVMEVEKWPTWNGTGSAQKGESFSYEGEAKWKNPDWECNVNRDKGFWKMRFRMAAKPQFTEEGYCWFHRIDRRIKLRGNVCAVPEAPCVDAAAPYCYSGFMGNTTNDVGLGANAAIGN